jgi:hypothetical protein
MPTTTVLSVSPVDPTAPHRLLDLIIDAIGRLGPRIKDARACAERLARPRSPAPRARRGTRRTPATSLRALQEARRRKELPGATAARKTVAEASLGPNVQAMARGLRFEQEVPLGSQSVPRSVVRISIT